MKKSKHSKSTHSSKSSNDPDIMLNDLRRLFTLKSLSDFCPRKHFEVIFGNELTEYSKELQKGLISMSRNREEESNVTFITQEEVFEFIKLVDECDEEDYKEFIHPPDLFPVLKIQCEEISETLSKDEQLDRKQMALILKQILINRMYKQYANNFETAYRRITTDKILESLQTRAKTLLAKDKKKPAKTTVGKAKPKDMNIPKLDAPLKLKSSNYMLHELPEPIIESDELSDNIYFYIFIGFEDPELFKYLEQCNVLVHCCLQISNHQEVSENDLTPYWEKIYQMSKSGATYTSMEHVVLMRFVVEREIPGFQEKRKIYFQRKLYELSNLLLNIIELKRRYHHYLQNLYLRTYEETKLKYAPFEIYEKKFKGIPIEYITMSYILQSILEEIHGRDDSEENSFCSIALKQDKLKSDHKICPFKFHYFLPRTIIMEEPHIKKENFRMFYKGDVVNMALSANTKALQVALSDLKFLANQKFFNVLSSFKQLQNVESETHLHHTAVPGKKHEIFTVDQSDHIINLFYLNHLNHYKIDLYKKFCNLNYLCTLDEYYENRDYLPNSISTLHSDDNLYSKFDHMQYRWSEPLSNSVLMQWLFEAEQEFSFSNYRYCSKTNSLLIYFHNNLSPAGTYTKIWDEYFRTVTCFRDFCSFYLFKDHSWLSKNKPLRHVKKSEFLKYQEKSYFKTLYESQDDETVHQYKHYLVPFTYSHGVNDDDDECIDSTCPSRFCSDPELPEPNLDKIVDELGTYPSSTDLTKHCTTEIDPLTLLASDNSPQRYGLIGATNKFQSHDGLKITVDSTRFYFEKFKLALSVEVDGHTLFGHYSNCGMDPHVVLNDGTIVAFEIYKHGVLQDLNKNEQDKGPNTVIDLRKASSFLFFKNTEELLPTSFKAFAKKVLADENRHAKALYNIEAANIDLSPNELKNLMIKSQSVRKIIEDIHILYRLKYSKECFKICDRKYRDLKFIKRRKKFHKCAYNHLVKRILRAPAKVKPIPLCRRKIQLSKPIKPPKVDQVFKLKIGLPNGLLIENLLPESRNNELYIKQTHRERNRFKSIMNEEYRLFFEKGTIMVKYTDGNVKIYNSRGDIIDIKEKWRPSNPEAKSEKCFETLERCRKMMTEKMKRQMPFSYSPYLIYPRTRRGHLEARTRLKKSRALVNILNQCKLPYTKINIHSADEKLYRIRPKCVSRSNYGHSYSKFDFEEGTTTKTRNDEFKTIWLRSGNQANIFPDGTKITKKVHIEEEFPDKRKSGWIYVTHSYLYEHPCYAPVEYDAAGNTLAIHLKDEIKLEMSKQSCRFFFSENSKLYIDSGAIKFSKTCPKCNLGCTCFITTRESKSQAPDSEPLLICKDSYNKTFTSDFEGRCQVSRAFVYGELNRAMCNHFKNNDYQKVFVIHQNLTGEMLWNDNMVARELADFEKPSKRETYVEKIQATGKGLEGVKFFRSYYDKLSEKYSWGSYLVTEKQLMALILAEKKFFPNYQIIRKVHNMVPNNEMNDLNCILERVATIQSRSKYGR